MFHCPKLSRITISNDRKDALTSPIINNYLTFVNEKATKCEKINILLEKYKSEILLMKTKD